MSSTIASASRKSLSDGAIRLPSRLSTPTAIAMSVATGMPQPRLADVPAVIARKISAGTIMPPAAAIAGRAARRGSRSSPSTSSRLISSPTTKKKSVIKPLLIHSCSVRSSVWLPRLTATCVDQKSV